MKYKMVVIDIDGTLLNSDYTISPRNMAAINKARDKGVLVTLATGRNFSATLPYAQELGLDVPVITYNGAFVRYTEAEDIVLHRKLSYPMACRVIEIAQAHNLRISLYLDDRLFTYEGEEGYPGTIQQDIEIIDDLDKYLRREPTRILVMGEKEDLDLFSKEISQEKEIPYMVPFLNGNLEVLHPDVSKMMAVKEMAKFAGIKREEIIAIGDNNNDIEMIQYAGLGVAMGNSPDSVKLVADLVTATNMEDGVAEVIEEYILRESE